VKCILKFFIGFFVLLALSGCFIAMPTDGPKEAQVNVGKKVELQRDILVVTYFTTPIAWEASDTERIGKDQEILKTLKKGSVLKIKSIKSFRMPYGIHFAYRCVEESSGMTFDLNFDMKDSIGL
jgi:hypothetical protein